MINDLTREIAGSVGQLGFMCTKKSPFTMDDALVHFVANLCSRSHKYDARLSVVDNCNF